MERREFIKNFEVGAPGKILSKKLNSELTIGSQFKDTVKTIVRNVQPGIFEIFVSVGDEDGTPVYELPYSGNDGLKRYKLGEFRIDD